MREAVDGGCRGFFLTVDSPTLGNREADFRAQGLAGNVSLLFMTRCHASGSHFSQMDDAPHDTPNRDVFGYYDTTVTWDDLPWIKEHANGLPVYIKGVATVEVRECPSETCSALMPPTSQDVALARKHGAAGVILSNRAFPLSITHHRSVLTNTFPRRRAPAGLVRSLRLGSTCPTLS